MKTEINALVSFFQQHVEQQSTRPASFDADALAARLQARYAGHWHPQDPEQGSGYRSFTVRCLEPHHRGLAEAFAPEALFWVDPGCVAARLSAHAPLTTIYGSLPKKLQRDAAEGSPVKEDGQLPSYLSPVKRTNRAIQIIHPSIRTGPSVSIAPPTPCTAANVDLFAPHEQVKAHSPASEPSSADSATTFDSLLSKGHAPAAAVRGHRHTSSSASSSMSTSSSAPPSRPSSSLSVREHSNGKVGVLGGGVRLGCAAGDDDSMVLVHSEDDSVGNVSASDSSSGDLSSASNNTGSAASSASGARSGSGRRRRRDHRGKRGSGNGAAKQAARQARADQESERLQKQQQQQQQQQDRAPRWAASAAFPPLHSAADPFFASRFGQQHVPSWTFPRQHPSQQPIKLAF